MATLVIELQTGFKDDLVVIRVNGEEVLSEKVTEKLLYGLAKSVPPVPVPDGPVRVEITLPDRNVAAATDLHATGTTYLGVSIEQDGSIGFIAQDKPFLYH